jgi:hypothetical protein
MVRSNQRANAETDSARYCKAATTPSRRNSLDQLSHKLSISLILLFRVIEHSIPKYWACQRLPKSCVEADCVSIVVG